MFLEKFNKTGKDHFESFQYLPIGYPEKNCRLKLWTENIVQKFISVLFSNGNGTEWSPIRSVIIRVISKSHDHAAGVRFVYHEYDNTKLDDTKSYYRLIIKITISEKRRMDK